MSSLRAKGSRLRKELAINLSSLGILLSFSAGYAFGEGNWRIGILLVGIYLLVDNVTGRLWFWVIEKISGKTND